ncbi:hypothetical protein HanXRQr2_Chr17g0800761 [Helianthus annuus]|uniref:Uncharacterized protein n=1 Tax=Helianthus annuus TaxID=4232 RepID=A0A9K3GUH1_HELAN|nr:hypothetical protein HanXRQr2_Chr17g0800761 [Helianthus annuus]KAJ0812998.1 hypothetical protein HanPSC8_Chr17g0768401 [Helianthus annuus]
MKASLVSDFATCGGSSMLPEMVTRGLVSERKRIDRPMSID